MTTLSKGAGVAGVALALSGCMSASDLDGIEDTEVEQVSEALGGQHGRSFALARLGQRIFDDTSLSASGTQACASCHVEELAFTGNANPDDPSFPVSTGAFPDLVGSRNTPTAKYMLFSPSFSFVQDEGEFIPLGGQFWDGRSDTLADQAKQPFLNPREMAMPSQAAVIEQIEAGPYSNLFRYVFGRDAFDDVEQAYEQMAEAVEAFESTRRFAPFTSKFDWVLRGMARFTPSEQQGFELFKDPEKGNCIGCHVGDEASRDPQDWLFTDFTYDNLGVPRNELISDNADPEFFDLGVCQHPGIVDKVPLEAGDAEELVEGLCGAFKVPTLRNVGITGPYMHNGKFASLEEVVSFYVTRDTNADRWYPVLSDGSVAKFNDLPVQYHGNVNTGEAPYDRQPGEAPRLSPSEIRAVVAFLETLTDGYEPGWRARGHGHVARR